MQCPSCGAMNSNRASWCSLCLHVFRDIGADVSSSKRERIVAVPRPQTEASEVPGPSDSAVSLSDHALTKKKSTAPLAETEASLIVSERSSGFVIPSFSTPSSSTPSSSPYLQIPTASRQRSSTLGIVVNVDGRITWKCKTCSTTNSIEDLNCRVCEKSLLEPLKSSPRAKKQRNLRTKEALLWSLIPGGGQWRAGLQGQAIARGALVAWLFVIAVLLWNPLVRWAQLTFLAAAGAAWAVSAFDAYRMAGGARDRGLLIGKKLAAAFVGSLVLLFSISFVIAITVTNSSRNSPTVVGQTTDASTGAVVQGPLESLPRGNSDQEPGSYAGSGGYTQAVPGSPQGVS